MAPKKKSKITKSAAEKELAVLSGESSKPPQNELQQHIQNLLDKFLTQQNAQQTTLFKTLTEMSLQSTQAILSTVNKILNDLATLSDRATKDQKAINRGFSQAAQNWSARFQPYQRYRAAQNWSARFQPYQRYRGSFRSNYSYNNYRRFKRGQYKKRWTNA